MARRPFFGRTTRKLDETSEAIFIAVCDALAGTFTKVGRLLWVGGYFFGRDRVVGRLRTSSVVMLRSASAQSRRLPEN